MFSHVELAGVSQQCCVPAVQNWSGPPSVVALSGQRSVAAPASALGGCSVMGVTHDRQAVVFARSPAVKRHVAVRHCSHCERGATPSQ